MGKKTGPKGEWKDFDWNLLESMVTMMATERYIAERMLIGENEEVNKNTIAAKVKLIQRRIEKRFGCNFVQYTEQKKDATKVKLVQAMLEVALKTKNVTMLIWLSKNFLGWSDKTDSVVTTSAEPTLTMEQIVELEKKRRANG